MKVLILEGIASSGKTTITANLQKSLPELNIRVVSEAETHIPIMEKTSDKHIDFFKSLIRMLLAENPDVLIFDRLYLTQAFRAKCALEEYAELEDLLAKYSPMTVFLKVGEAMISDRISKSSEHRGSDYFRSRGNTKEEIAQYYIDQQQNQLELLKQSKLPYKIFDTTNHNYDEIVQEILEFIKE